VYSFISQFSRLVNVFKCYKVYSSNDQNGVYHETKLLKMVVSHSFQDIGNELNKFHLYKIGFIPIKLVSPISS
jgi:hypothetical protein